MFGNFNGNTATRNKYTGSIGSQIKKKVLIKNPAQIFTKNPGTWFNLASKSINFDNGFLVFGSPTILKSINGMVVEIDAGDFNILFKNLVSLNTHNHFG